MLHVILQMTAAALASSIAHSSQNPTSTSRQIIVVTTPDWTSTTGTLRRFERQPSGPWVAVGGPSAVVVGRTGVALGLGFESLDRTGPAKHEGDGKAPAGVFPLDTAFGFAPRDSVRNIRLPYTQLMPGSDCVDDTTSAHYNTVVDKQHAGRVDWSSAEHMREIWQYQIGVIVGYNAPRPTRGRGSCIFLHIWNGPSSSTAGCTAFDVNELRRVVEWLDPTRNPMLVQFPRSLYGIVSARWKLPAV
jgi:L,D-peptidoglycan transpeptidase YkuD (ErfK/YbiS/YcfS/YnhG family)